LSSAFGQPVSRCSLEAGNEQASLSHKSYPDKFGHSTIDQSISAKQIVSALTIVYIKCRFVFHGRVQGGQVWLALQQG
jgi:hypothetical protein